jgi:hypothetical protein
MYCVVAIPSLREACARKINISATRFALVYSPLVSNALNIILYLHSLAYRDKVSGTKLFRNVSLSTLNEVALVAQLSTTSYRRMEDWRYSTTHS